jgi:serine/threonine protein kinase
VSTSFSSFVLHPEQFLIHSSGTFILGDVKIFDFGLAKEINPANQDESGFYKLTEDTGSPRYMAVEGALETLWKMLTMATIFCVNSPCQYIHTTKWPLANLTTSSWMCTPFVFFCGKYFS